MQADDLSLLRVLIGPRGACKTLAMTGLGIESLGRAQVVLLLRKARNNPNLYPRRKVNIWSNYEFHAPYFIPGFRKPFYLKPKPLDIEKLITWDKEYHDGHIYWDEIDQNADRQDWMNTVSKLLNAGVKLFRHRNLSMTCSLQELDELNIRLYKQADIIIKCRDLFRTPWGRSHGLEPGEVANTVWIDKSGMLTGYSFQEKSIVYPMKFMGKRFHTNYDTHGHRDMDVVGSKTKYRLKLPVKEIVSAEVLAQESQDREALKQAVAFFAYGSPGDKPFSTELFQKASELGFNASRNVAGRMLKELGAVSESYGNYMRYNLDGVKIY